MGDFGFRGLVTWSRRVFVSRGISILNRSFVKRPSVLGRPLMGSIAVAFGKGLLVSGLR